MSFWLCLLWSAEGMLKVSLHVDQEKTDTAHSHASCGEQSRGQGENRHCTTHASCGHRPRTMERPKSPPNGRSHIKRLSHNSGHLLFNYRACNLFRIHSQRQSQTFRQETIPCLAKENKNTHLFASLFVYWLVCLFVCLLYYLLVFCLSFLFVRLFVRLFICSFVCTSVYCFVPLFL